MKGAWRLGSHRGVVNVGASALRDVGLYPLVSRGLDLGLYISAQYRGYNIYYV